MTSLIIIIVCILFVLGGIAGGVWYRRSSNSVKNTPVMSVAGRQAVPTNHISKKNFQEIDGMYKARLRVLRGEVDTAMTQMHENDKYLKSLLTDHEICNRLREETTSVTTRVAQFEQCASMTFKEVLRASGAPMQISSEDEEWKSYNARVHEANMRLRSVSDRPFDDRLLVVSEIQAQMNDVYEQVARSEHPDVSSERERLNKASEHLRLTVGKFVDCVQDLRIGQEDMRVLVNKIRTEVNTRGLKSEVCDQILTPAMRVDEVARFSNCALRLLLNHILPEDLKQAKDVGSMMTHFDDIIQKQQTARRGTMSRANTINDKIVTTLTEHYDAVKEDPTLTKTLERDIARQREMSTQMRERIVKTIDRDQKRLELRAAPPKEPSKESTNVANKVQFDLDPRSEFKSVRKDLLQDFDRKAEPPAKRLDAQHAHLSNDILTNTETSNDLQENVESLTRLQTRIDRRPKSEEVKPILKNTIKPRPTVQYDLSEVGKEHIEYLTEITNLVMRKFEQPRYEPKDFATFEEAIAQFDNPYFTLLNHLGKGKRHTKDVLIWQMYFDIANDSVRFSKDPSGFTSGDNVIPMVGLYLSMRKVPSKASLTNKYLEETFEIGSVFEGNAKTAIETLVETELASELERVNQSILSKKGGVTTQGGGEVQIAKASALMARYLQRRVAPIYVWKWSRYVYHKRNRNRKDRYFLDYSLTVLVTLFLIGLRMDRLGFSYLIDSLLSLGLMLYTNNRTVLLLPYFVVPDVFSMYLPN